MSVRFKRIVVRARRLDAAAGVVVEAQLLEAWLCGVRAVALDLSPVEEVDSMGLSLLVAQNRKRPFGASIALCGVSEYVQDILEITQLHRVFDIFDSGDAAESALSA